MDVVPSLARQALSILLVFLLLGAVLWKARRGSFKIVSKKSRSMQQIERLALTPQHSLHLVRVQGREVLIATYPQGCRELKFEGSGASGAASLGEPGLGVTA